MPTPIFGEGTTISVNDGAAAAFVAINDVTQITPPQEAVVVVDRNRLSATTLVERAFSSRRDPGQCSFQAELDYEEAARLALLMGTSQSWRIDYTDGLRMAFTGRLISNPPDAVQGGAIVMFTGTIQLTSLVTLTDAIP